MLPIVNGLEAEFSDQMTTYRLDAAVTENEQLMVDFGLRGHPAFVVLDSEEQATRTFFGPQTAEELRSAIREVLP